MLSSKYLLRETEVPLFAKKIIQNLKHYQTILLNGEIGSGKTFLVKEIAKQLGEKKVVNSPSFQIMNVYKNFIHMDAYNLKGNLESYYDFFGDKIVIIEWSKNLDIIIKPCIEINIIYSNENQRLYEVKEVK